ncbi:MAG: hypothetical protein ACETVO_00485 [bacterium]
MYEVIEEPIQVGAIFKGSKIKPRWFIWKKRKYPIRDVTFRWQDRKGEETLLYFSVSDGVNTYEICFNQKSLNWFLSKVSIEG